MQQPIKQLVWQFIQSPNLHAPLAATPSQNTRRQKGQVLPGRDSTPSGQRDFQVMGTAHTEFIQDTVIRAAQAMQGVLLTQLSEKMTQLFQTNMAVHLQPGAMINPRAEMVPNVEDQVLLDHHSGLAGSSRNTPRSFASDLGQRPDKVGHILNT